MALDLDNCCEHGIPRFLCRLGCNGNDGSGAAAAGASSPAGEVLRELSTVKVLEFNNFWFPYKKSAPGGSSSISSIIGG